MKLAKVLALGAVLLLVGAGVGAQRSTVVLHNAEHSSFHYLLDPDALRGLDSGSSIFPSVVADFFAAEVTVEAESTAFAELGAGQTQRLEGLAEGTHLLVGFFAVAGRREFPVRALSLEAGGGPEERSYTLSSEPPLVSVRAGQGRLAAYGPVSALAAEVGQAAATEPSAAVFRFQIDNRYDDWDPIPAFARYAPEYAPQSFTRERYGGAPEVLPIGSARSWTRGGTSLSELKIVDDPQAVYLYAAARTAIDPNLSIFLYLHGGERGGVAPNRLTLELVPSRGEEPGLVVLWEQGREPALVGELASGNFFLEARADKAQLERALLAVDPEVSFFDLTTALFDRGELSYEEFYYGSVALAQIPTLDTLYSTPRP